MLFGGEFIDAPTALEWGLVNRVAQPDQLLEAAMAMAETLKSKPRESLAIGKALFYRQLEQGLEAAYKDATCVIASNMDSDVAREGVDAFFAKRPPNWKD
jgi:enoyl-CoA hydratase/carnithine racemase